MTAEKKTLLIDADDTLWENNVYFEEAMALFLAVMEDLGFAPEAIRQALNELERKNIKIRGYGSKKLTLSMKEAFLLHCGPSNHHCIEEHHELISIHRNGHSLTLTAEADAAICQMYCGEDRNGCLLRRIDQIGLNITGRPMTLLPGVEETLRELTRRHPLILFTKGDPAEQMDKVKRSGLESYFHAVEIAHEKDPDAYRGLVDKYQLMKEATWMVGNSPRSDINPATLAGLRAIFIPHSCTWELEEEAILRRDRVTILRSFGELLTLF